MSAPFGLEPIGVVRSTRTEPTDDGWDAESARIELVPPFDDRSLQGLAAFSHCLVVFVFDRATWDGVTVARRPRGNPDWPEVGIFAQRAKDRPNRLGVSVARILAVEGPVVHVSGLDAVEGTPVVDLKPWMDAFGPRGTVTEPDWAGELMRGYWTAGRDQSAGLGGGSSRRSST